MPRASVTDVRNMWKGKSDSVGERGAIRANRKQRVPRECKAVLLMHETNAVRRADAVVVGRRALHQLSAAAYYLGVHSNQDEVRSGTGASETEADTLVVDGWWDLHPAADLRPYIICRRHERTPLIQTAADFDPLVTRRAGLS